MSTKVVTVSSRTPSEPYYRLDVFLKSLDRLGVQPVILGMNEPWHGLMTKPNHFRKWLRDGNAAGERIIICDCWDIIFSQRPEEISERCQQTYGDAIVFNGEKGCWPRGELAEKFPDQGTAWRYLNSGFMCGPSEKILFLLESMELERIGVDRKSDHGTMIEPNDQGEFQYAFTCQPVPMVVDARCLAAQTFSACTPEEFEITSDGVKNLATGGSPGVLHFNGGSKNDIMPLVMAAMGL